MDLNLETYHRKEFCEILFDLAKSQEKFQDAYYRANMYQRLEALYDAPSPEQRFRHFYSDIFSVLTQIKQNPELGDINILGQNLDLIRIGYHSRNNADDGHSIDVSDAIKKLYDHVSLDIARISYSDAGDWKISGEEVIINLQAQLKNMSQNIKDVQSDSEVKISNQQKEYISILGIFASVVLAFIAGIAFSTSVLENISQSSMYRTTMISLIIGLVIVNILFGLFFYINKIVCKEENIHPLVVSNAIIICLMILTLIAWSLGLVESRNQKITASQSSILYQNPQSNYK